MWTEVVLKQMSGWNIKMVKAQSAVAHHRVKVARLEEDSSSNLRVSGLTPNSYGETGQY